MRDKENNVIEFNHRPNEHIFLWGQSGQGKSYFICRQIEQEAKAGKKVLVLDYSGSYTEEELEKNGIADRDQVKIWDICKIPQVWRVPSTKKEEYKAILADSIAAALKIQSYGQIACLHWVLEDYLDRHLFFSFHQLFEDVKRFRETADIFDVPSDKEPLDKLLSRLCPYGGLENFYVHFCDGVDEYLDKPINILQISGFSHKCRKFLTNFILELLWHETRMSRSKRRFQTVVLDEIQFLSLNEDSAFSAMLREGRKYNLGVIAATQFLSAYEKAEIETLMQAGHMMIFKPNAKDLRASARIISEEKATEWQAVLKKLKVGEAVLLGEYHVNNCKKLAGTPIVCRI